MVADQQARAGACAWARSPSRRLLADNADDQRDRRRRRHSSAKCRQAHAWAEPRQREKAQANDRARRPQPSPADGCRHDSDRAGQRDGLGADDGDIPAIDGFTSDRPLPNMPCQHRGQAAGCSPGSAVADGAPTRDGGMRTVATSGRSARLRKSEPRDPERHEDPNLCAGVVAELRTQVDACKFPVQRRLAPEGKDVHGERQVVGGKPQQPNPEDHADGAAPGQSPDAEGRAADRPKCELAQDHPPATSGPPCAVHVERGEPPDVECRARGKHASYLTTDQHHDWTSGIGPPGRGSVANKGSAPGPAPVLGALSLRPRSLFAVSPGLSACVPWAPSARGPRPHLPASRSRRGRPASAPPSMAT